MIIFRADGNKEIGTGHIMRCLSVADALSVIGRKSVFVTADSSLKDLIESRGYECFVLHTDYQKTEEELSILLRQNFFALADGIVVDSYFVTDGYLKILSAEKKTAYIDDYLAVRPVNVLINYNIFASKKEYADGINVSGQTMLLGPAYAPLRREFMGIVPKEVPANAKKILFLAGGSDPVHAALSFAREVLSHSDDRTYTIVTGAMSGDKEAINKLSDESGGRIRHLSNVTDMKSLMCETDIAVSAAGSTLYELCACGVPVINYILADNQRLIAEGFAERKAMIYAGDLRGNKDFFKEIYAMISDLASDRDKRADMSDKARALVDGKGARRLAGELEGEFYKA